jgi:hypothetical protein
MKTSGYSGEEYNKEVSFRFDLIGGNYNSSGMQ